MTSVPPESCWAGSRGSWINRRTSLASRARDRAQPGVGAEMACTKRRRYQFARSVIVLTLASSLTAQAPNPFAGRKLYVDPDSNAQRQAETWRRSRPVDSELIARIANQPQANWFGDWITNVRREVNQMV